MPWCTAGLWTQMGCSWSFTQKLTLLSSLYFLPTTARADFHFQVILPSVAYGVIIWGSCGKVLLDELSKIQVRTAKIICNIDWYRYMPSREVLTRTTWRTLKSLYEHKLLLLAHNSFYGLSPSPIAHLPKTYTNII